MTKDEALKLALAALDGGHVDRAYGYIQESLAQTTEERNFCPRCGKRLSSGFVEISIHTCTPPKEKQ
jgi:formate dehydrogenase maturation protein FdhE